MSDTRDTVYRALWSSDLEEVDQEIARMAAICQVKILDAGVIRRILQKDASVCGTHNPVAFGKLHDLVMLHGALREKIAHSFGQAQTAAIEDYIVERLRKSFPDLGGPWSPA